MTQQLHVHRLGGCSPRPLASYLKALGVLRLIAEQKDPEARGWWQGESFCLLTSLDAAALEDFFMTEYRPTPFVSPWNRDSGFYDPADPVLAKIISCPAPRLAEMRAGMQCARAGVSALLAADQQIRSLKAQSKAHRNMTPAQRQQTQQQLSAEQKKFAALRADFFVACARSWRGAHRRWYDAALVLLEDGKPLYASLLGTGGNDGRLDFTYNAAKHIVRLFDLDDPRAPARPETRDALRHSLWGHAVPGVLVEAAIGQFAPGFAGGANSSTGASADGSINAWDFVLMLEGAILFSCRATRRLDPLALARASAPFAMSAHACGHASAGQEEAARGEQWLPLWTQPSTVSDLAAMIGEARLQLGRAVADRPIDAARAIATLGTARGIAAFERYAYLERNGQANLAVPLGRIEVRERPLARLIDDLSRWLTRLQRAARSNTAPARLVHAERRLADAVFAALTHDPSPDRWQAILLCAQQIEAIQVAGTAFDVGPIPRLSPRWLEAADDGTAEWRLACALGSAAADWRHRQPVDPVRDHWFPLDPQRPNKDRTTDEGRRIDHPARLVVTDRDPLANAIAVVERRILEAGQRGERTLPIVAAPGRAASWADLDAVLSGAVDVERVLRLAQALMALDWSSAPAPSPAARRTAPSLMPEPAWLAIRCCCLGFPLPNRLRIPCDPELIRRLRAGNAGGALAIARQRLRASGIRVPFQTGSVDAETARRWAAALIFPISPRMAADAIAHLDPAQRTQGAYHG